ncbi:hypothetical protein HPULCUR_005458 [Helicostylum pulchrum]|uniref:Uncharacterized protein n=1 Tax=Helicostylum pulchrum TaxID=562976 RepID=A0ABP9XZ94_9FUNG
MPTLMNAWNQTEVPFLVPLMLDSDGGGVISKLELSSTQFNLLVTGSLVIYPHVSNTTSIGPTCNTFIANEDLKDCMLFFSEAKVEKLMNEFKNPLSINAKTANTENIRQPTTLLQHRTTYLGFRAHLFDDRLLHSATIFTLSKYPTKGFSMSVNNSNRLLSEFFAICCESVLFHNAIINTNRLQPLLSKIDDGAYVLVDNLSEKLSASAQTISSQLNLTNKKIEANFESELYRVFG